MSIRDITQLVGRPSEQLPRPSNETRWSVTLSFVANVGVWQFEGEKKRLLQPYVPSSTRLPAALLRAEMFRFEEVRLGGGVGHAVPDLCPTLHAWGDWPDGNECTPE